MELIHSFSDGMSLNAQMGIPHPNFVTEKPLYFILEEKMKCHGTKVCCDIILKCLNNSNYVQHGKLCVVYRFVGNRI